jgi:hypothetical protein
VRRRFDPVGGPGVPGRERGRVRAAVRVTEGRFVAPTLATAVVRAIVLQDAAGKEVGRFNATAIVG